MRRFLKSFIRRSPILRPLHRFAQCVKIDPDLLFVKPGHHYSPIPSREDQRRCTRKWVAEVPEQLAGIDLDVPTQLALLECFARYYNEQPWSLNRTAGTRYFLDNPAYSSFDGLIYYCMLRHFKPRRVIEVGSGYSSCAFLDVNERFLDHSVALTCIEPYPRSLLKRIWPGDRERIELVSQPLQDIAVERFTALGEGDVLFIDSSHVCKAGSDVNYLFSEILPNLADGVRIHIHDIFYPFEYPPAWTEQGRAWNETYVLRAFLQNNKRFHIEFFNSYLAHFQRDRLLQDLPLCLHPLKTCPGVPSGSSLWLRVG